MTKPDRIRDGGTETEREAKKKRNLSPSPSGEVHPLLCEPDDRAALQLQHAPPEMRDDQYESVTETDGAPVEEMTNEVEENEELSFFTPKSPITRPYIPDELNGAPAHREILAAFEDAQAKYKAKLRRRYHLVTFQHERKLAPSCLFQNPQLLPIRERAKKAVLHAAKSITRLSSSIDGKPLANSCGLWIKWDQERRTGIVLTTAHLIRTKHPTENHWEGKDEYNIKANVTVHLLDDTIAEGHFLYHQQHYEIAFFEVRVNEPVQLASFNDTVHCGQDVFSLGRDDLMNLRITHGRVECWNPGSNERYHYLYFLHQKNDYQSNKKNDDYLTHQKNDDYMCDDDGGSIIDLDGKIVGLVNKHLKNSFLPSSIMDKCVDMWCEFGCIPRLHFGMKFTSIKLLDPIHVEKMWRMYKIEKGLIIQEVSKESHAEKHGICIGDIIEGFNGESISTTIELESMLLSRCRKHLDQGNRLNDNIDVPIQVFPTEERFRRTINLTVNVSDGGEVVRRRTCPITEGTSTSVQSSQHVADDSCLPRPTFTWEDLAQRYT